ncbi:MAG: DUF3267 domain-containing protein, partial [Fibrobacter sp.]|nr:DUF3267 domain-containing protein [Fibrobacter sp.]
MGLSVSALIIKPFSAGVSFPVPAVFALAAVMLVYIVLHELVHGAVYKLLTGQKLTFGFKASVAYCGVPDIYVYRRTALAALLAPFVVFDIV